jgi:tRNA dimethylallyltransferase
VLLNLNPNLHNTTDLLDKKRIISAILVAENSNKVEKNDEMDFLIIGLNIEREMLKERIRTRLKDRLKNGMIQEAESLIISGVSHEKLRFFGLEYKFLSMYLSGEMNYNDMYQKLASAIIQFSKRQMTWFRKMEKEGVKIHWLNNKQTEKAEQLITSFLK